MVIIGIWDLSRENLPKMEYKKWFKERARQVMRAVVSELIVSLFRKNIGLKPISEALPFNTEKTTEDIEKT